MSYRPSGRKQAPEPVEYVDEEYDSMGSDIDENYVTEEYGTAPVESAAIAVPSKHLATERFGGLQRVTFDIEIVASPEELASKDKHQWNLLPHITKLLKQNMAEKNRDKATDDQLAGDLRKAIPMDMIIVQQQNSFPYAMGFTIDGMMNTNLHKHGACVWRVPANTQTMMVEKKVFSPTNIIDEHMYEKAIKCGPEDLENDIKMVAGAKGKPGYATVRVNSVAYKELKRGLSANPVLADELTDAEYAGVYNPGHRRDVQVTTNIANALKAKLEQPLREIADRCIDMEQLKVEVVRADGNPKFNSPKGMVGVMVGSPADPQDKMTTIKLSQTCIFHVKGEIGYLTM